MYLTVLLSAISGFSDFHLNKLTLLTNISKACFISVFLRLYMNGFNMGVTTVYITEAMMSLESHDEDKK